MNHPARATPDRVINHVRLCFLAYWLSARLGGQWRARGETEEVPRVLRHLQTIRLGVMKLGPHVQHAVMTDIPKNLNDQLVKLGLGPLFVAPWVVSRCSLLTGSVACKSSSTGVGSPNLHSGRLWMTSPQEVEAPAGVGQPETLA